MLNLLISILGDTYDRVQIGKTLTNSQALIEIFQDVEVLLFWNRNKSKKSYMQVCQVVGEDDETWEGKIN